MHSVGVMDGVDPVRIRGQPGRQMFSGCQTLAGGCAVAWDLFLTDEDDPWRSAILLVGGDKSGNGTRWYRTAIPRAERLRDEYVRAHSLAEVRRRKGLTQRQVADVMVVSTGRISQIEHGDLSGLDVLDRYEQALGGTGAPWLVASPGRDVVDQIPVDLGATVVPLP